MRYSEPLTYNGQTHTMSEWAKITGISLQTLCSRRRKGWSAEDIVTKPVRQKKLLFWDGVRITYDDLGRAYGLSGSLLRNRVVHQKIPIREALRMPNRNDYHSTNVFRKNGKYCRYPDCDNCPYPDCKSS